MTPLVIFSFCLSRDYMVFVSIVFVRDQPTLVELLEDSQGNGKLYFSFFVHYQNRILVFILSLLEERFNQVYRACESGAKITLYVAILQIS